jgi:hypothetical protein
MPCVYYTDHDLRRMDAEAIAKQRADLDRLTRMLCTTIRTNPNLVLDAETTAWWVQHQEDDRRREAGGQS